MAGAIGWGVTAGKFAKGLMINYTKGWYEDKVDELSNLISRLQRHLKELDNLKDELSTFWDDENAQKMLQTTKLTIDKTSNAMKLCEGLMATFKDTISKMDTAKSNLGSFLDDAVGLLESLDF